LLLCAGLAAMLAIAPAAGAVKKRKIGNFDHPVYVTGAPGFPKLEFVVEQPGSVRVVKGHHKLRHAFLNIRGLVGYDGAERGLLSIAFPPDYKQSGRFYVDYTDKQGDINVVEYQRRSATKARAGSARLVLSINHRANANHNGGQLQFLGNLLYISTGDGGSGGDPPNNAQNTDSLLGKILRIDPRPSGGQPFSIPSDNPFVGKPGRDEIFSYGFRNPWRFSFDSANGNLAIGDVGQSAWEEIDYVTRSRARGSYFGWPTFEGNSDFDPSRRDPNPNHRAPIFPIHVNDHSRDCAIIGGYVVHSTALSLLNGRYVYSDNCNGAIRSLVPSTSGASGHRSTGLSVSGPSGFGVGGAGQLYVASLGDGHVYQVIQRP
jgi:glucose/arabinose dehydrogenase